MNWFEKYFISFNKRMSPPATARTDEYWMYGWVYPWDLILVPVGAYFYFKKNKEVRS